MDDYYASGRLICSLNRQRNYKDGELFLCSLLLMVNLIVKNAIQFSRVLMDCKRFNVSDIYNVAPILAQRRN